MTSHKGVEDELNRIKSFLPPPTHPRRYSILSTEAQLVFKLRGIILQPPPWSLWNLLFYLPLRDLVVWKK